MATNSIFKTIKIDSEESLNKFVNALEKAHQIKSSNNNDLEVEYEEIKKKDIKKFFKLY